MVVDGIYLIGSFDQFQRKNLKNNGKMFKYQAGLVHRLCLQMKLLISPATFSGSVKCK